MESDRPYHFPYLPQSDRLNIHIAFLLGNCTGDSLKAGMLGILFIAPFMEIPMFKFKYLVMLKVYAMLQVSSCMAYVSVHIVGRQSKPRNSDFYQNDFLSSQEYQTNVAHSDKFS